MLQVEIQLKGDREVIKQLKAVGDSLGDWKPTLRTIADYFQNYFGETTFEFEGVNLGLPWPDLSQPYKDKKRVEFSGKGILERTGDLRKGWRTEVNKEFALIENKVPYGIYHQSTKPRKRLPRRALMHFNEQSKQYIVNEFASDLAKKIKAAL